MNGLINGVKLFGSELSMNSTLAYVLVIIGMALLLGAIITLLVMLVLSLRKKKEDEEENDEQLNLEEQAEEIEEVAAAAAELPEEESVAGGVLTYDRSFTAKYIQSSDDIKQYYIKIKNQLLSYKKVGARMSWKRESFHKGRETIARLTFRGKTLCLYLALDPAKFTDSKYAVEDVKEIASYADTPCLYRIRSDRRENYAEELIAELMTEKGIIKTDRPSEDYYLPYEGIVELIEKGLIKRVIRDTSFPDLSQQTV